MYTESRDEMRWDEKMNSKSEIWLLLLLMMMNAKR